MVRGHPFICSQDMNAMQSSSNWDSESQFCSNPMLMSVIWHNMIHLYKSIYCWLYCTWVIYHKCFYQVYPISSNCSSLHSCTWTKTGWKKGGYWRKKLLDQHKNSLWVLHYIHPWLIGISHTFMDINGVGWPDVPLCAWGDSRAFSLLFTRPANWDVVPHCYWQ